MEGKKGKEGSKGTTRKGALERRRRGRTGKYRSRDGVKKGRRKSGKGRRKERKEGRQDSGEGECTYRFISGGEHGGSTDVQGAFVRQSCTRSFTRAVSSCT